MTSPLRRFPTAKLTSGEGEDAGAATAAAAAAAAAAGEGTPSQPAVLDAAALAADGGAGGADAAADGAATTATTAPPTSPADAKTSGQVTTGGKASKAARKGETRGRGRRGLTPIRLAVRTTGILFWRRPSI